MSDRILLLEDDTLIAMDLEDELADHGYVAVCAAKVSQAEAILTQETPCFAILDMQLNGETSFPVAERLKAKGVPFVFVSGNDASALPDTLKGSQIITKPVQLSALLTEIDAVKAVTSS